MTYRSIVSMLGVAIVMAVSGAAQAATDIRTVTCGQYLGMPAEASRNFSAWMSGWFSYQSRRTFVDFSLHQTNVANVKAWCQSNPGQSVMVGLETAVGVKAQPGATLDFNKITCGNWLGYGPEDRNFVVFFMSGYYNAAANDSVLDGERLQKNANAVAAYCAKNKSRTLPTAIQNRAK